jgi:hypothetical protein
MKELHDLITALTVVDGGCRDINYEAPTWEGVEALYAYLKESYQTVSGTDSEGRPLDDLEPQFVVGSAQGSGAVQIIYEGGDLINHLQLFIYREPEGIPFVELTFFPQDIRQYKDLRNQFIAWADQLQTCVGASRYYARYENASWQFGDVNGNSGVFLVSD